MQTFASEASTGGLRLSIVQTLVETELDGSIATILSDGEPGRAGTVVRVLASTVAW